MTAIREFIRDELRQRTALVNTTGGYTYKDGREYCEVGENLEYWHLSANKGGKAELDDVGRKAIAEFLDILNVSATELDGLVVVPNPHYGKVFNGYPGKYWNDITRSSVC